MVTIMKIRELRSRHRLLFSAALVTFLLAVTWALIPITFETNDDEYLMNYFSGAKTGSRYYTNLFFVGENRIFVL